MNPSMRSFVCEPDQRRTSLVKGLLWCVNQTERNFQLPKSYDEIAGVIAAKYENENEAKERSSERFWEDLQKLFRDNTSADSIPDVALEVYLMLLFEIARRLVRQPDQKPSGGATAGKKEALDCLPIGVAIARMLVVKPNFRKVFLEWGRIRLYQCVICSKATQTNY